MLMRTVALSVLAAGLCVNPTIVLATGQTSIPVRVVNTPGVAITNVPSVSVENLPPQPVREIFALQPRVTIPAGSGDSGPAFCARVPAGRFLVLEQLQVQLNSNTRSQWIGLSIRRLQAGGADAGLVSVPVDRRTLPNFPGLGSFVLASQITLRFEPGQQVCFGLNRLDALAEAETGVVYVEGYLTDRL